MLSAEDARKKMIKVSWKGNSKLKEEYEIRKKLQLHKIEEEINVAVLQERNSVSHLFKPEEFQRMRDAANREDEFWKAALDLLLDIKATLRSYGYTADDGFNMFYQDRHLIQITW